MRRSSWAKRAVVGVAMSLGVLAVPAHVSACVSDQPSFAETIHGARAIARVTIVEGFDTYLDDPSHSETYRVDRVLKGSLPELVTIAPAWTSLCHDTVSYFAGAEASEGQTIIVAFDLSFGDQVIHPMWGDADGSTLFGTAELPTGVRTLAALESAILRQVGMPDTSTVGTSPNDPPSPLPLFVALSLLAAVHVLRRQPNGVE